MKELPIINLVNFTFITVANKSVQNVANNPRWATTRPGRHLASR